MDSVSDSCLEHPPSGGLSPPSASALSASCQCADQGCSRCTGQWLAPVSLARHPEVSKQLGVSVRTHQSSLYSTRLFSQGTLKMTGVSLSRWLTPAMMAVTQQLSVCRAAHCRGTAPRHHGWSTRLQLWSAGLHTAGAQTPPTTAASSEQQEPSEWPSPQKLSCHGQPQPLRGISDPSQQVKEVETHLRPQLLVSSSVHTLTQGSFPDALWPEESCHV